MLWLTESPGLTVPTLTVVQGNVHALFSYISTFTAVNVPLRVTSREELSAAKAVIVNRTAVMEIANAASFGDWLEFILIPRHVSSVLSINKRYSRRELQQYRTLPKANRRPNASKHAKKYPVPTKSTKSDLKTPTE
jgi:hypothetical protein